MTTASQHHGPSPRPQPLTSTVGSVVRATLLATLAVGIVVVAVGAVAAGSAAALGAAVGLAVVVVFFGFGTTVLTVVARVSPASSLLVALVTYTFEVVLVGLVFTGLHRSGALGTTFAPGWVAGAVIAATLVWTTSQIIATTRARQPVYELAGNGQEAHA